MNLTRLNKSLHRDVGYFLSGLIFAYCISGIALNHINDWNPDFVIEKRSITLDRAFTRDEITSDRIAEFTALVGETAPKLHDFPTAEQVKIYYDNASLLVNLVAKTGMYESIHQRPLFYQSNVLHRNSLKGWKWASDIFGGLLIFLTVSGWFMLKGRLGLLGRGKWLILAGFAPPVIAIIIFQTLQR
ncbi:MAG TPA: PepSY-associated TM helix domain-containing protein [Candidatus Acidoferrum sp.]|nr:PepSY-associated TM helix domain-containing protein [Candidatus Acidoferrum sp.]